MKQVVPTLLVGTLLGIGGSILALPALEAARETSIVRQAIHDFSLPELPPKAEVIYAFHKDEFAIEWYGFEIRMTPGEAVKWETKARGGLPGEVIDFDCELKDNGSIEVRITASNK